MAVPDFQQFFRPTLEIMADGKVRNADELVDAIAATPQATTVAQERYDNAN